MDETEPDDFDSLVTEVSEHLKAYLEKSLEAYPPGSTADAIATSVVENVIKSTDTNNQLLVKLCVFLVENLEEVSKTYEDFYTEEIRELKNCINESKSSLVSVEEENSRLREKIHEQNEKIRLKDLAMKTMKIKTGDYLSEHGNSGVEEEITLQEAVTEKIKEISSLERQLHEEKMKNREYDEKISLSDEDSEPELSNSNDPEMIKQKLLAVIADKDEELERLGAMHRELLQDMTDVHGRLQELMIENDKYRALSAETQLENQNLKTATKELRSTVEKLHKKLHSTDLLMNSSASSIFGEMSSSSERLRELFSSVQLKADADVRAADESFDVDGEEDIPDPVNGMRTSCSRCTQLKDCLKQMEERHSEEATRIREIVTQNVCMKAELEDWEADMREKVHQNVELSRQLEQCQQLLHRLSPKRSRGVFGNSLLRR